MGNADEELLQDGQKSWFRDDRMLSGCEATLVPGGHSHVQMVRRHRKLTICNPGSVGLPFDQNPWSGEVDRAEIRLAPWAEYAILYSRSGSFRVELRRVPLDVEAMRQVALASEWPGAAAWAESWSK